MRRDHQRLVDILDALDSLGRMIDGRTESEFFSDETLRYAAAQRLTVVGEAVARLSDEIKEWHGAVPWRDIVAFERIARIMASEFPD